MITLRELFQQISEAEGTIVVKHYDNDKETCDFEKDMDDFTDGDYEMLDRPIRFLYPIMVMNPAGENAPAVCFEVE